MMIIMFFIVWWYSVYLGEGGSYGKIKFLVFMYFMRNFFKIVVLYVFRLVLCFILNEFKDKWNYLFLGILVVWFWDI